MPQRFLEVQPGLDLDDLVGAVDGATAAATAAAAAAAAAEAFQALDLFQRPPEEAVALVGVALALRLVHAAVVFVGTRRFLNRVKLE